MLQEALVVRFSNSLMHGCVFHYQTLDFGSNVAVCPTTLKRICRQHGIMRWPSRKINKVNRSLRKIQTVLDSVHGIEGGLRFDSATGEFVAVCSSNGNNAHVMAEDASCEFLKPESVDNTIKLEDDIITNGKNHLYNHKP